MDNPVSHLSTWIASLRKTPDASCVELDSDLDLVKIFECFLQSPYPVYLDNVFQGVERRRFSYLSADPLLVLRSKGRLVELESRGIVHRLEENPFLVLQGLLQYFKVPLLSDFPGFFGGAIGYFAYELAHHLERLPKVEKDDLLLPDMNLGFYDWVVVRDHQNKETHAFFLGLDNSEKAFTPKRLNKIVNEVVKRDICSTSELVIQATHLKSNFSRCRYLAAVKKIKNYIDRGDVYQVNLSQRFEALLNCHPWDLYLRLRQLNPVSFSAYLEYPEVIIQSASPEEFLGLDGDKVRTRPMKGTRPRGKSSAEDLKLLRELLHSEKERAENLMIVDLLRNDLGKVCIPGTVKVPELFAIEKYPTVLQMVSTVQGRLQKGFDAVDILQACFPGGSVTGAPKIRAMKIISELEPSARSIYCGALGYIGFDGSMMTSIPIRTLLVKKEKVFFQVGGAVVADSDPDAEFEETLHKAQGSLDALGIYDR
mgnify:CR=1 FL=1